MSSLQPGAAEGPTGGQFLTFKLGAETYGVEILGVKEIRGWSTVSRIPGSPSHVLGVLNLRGAIVPIIDLRLRFALESVEYSSLTVIIVLSLRTAGVERECGIVVDAVSDVVDISPNLIQGVPAAIDSARANFIKGLANVDGQMLILLDTGELVTRESRSHQPAEEAA